MQGENVTSNSGNEWMTTADVANRLGVSVNTVVEWRRPRSRIKGPKVSRIGGSVRYHRDDVEAFIQGARGAAS